MEKSLGMIGNSILRNENNDLDVSDNGRNESTP